MLPGALGNNRKNLHASLFKSDWVRITCNRKNNSFYRKNRKKRNKHQHFSDSNVQ